MNSQNGGVSELLPVPLPGLTVAANDDVPAQEEEATAEDLCASGLPAPRPHIV